MLLVLCIENYPRSVLVPTLIPRADRTRCTATPSVVRMVTLRSTTPTRSSVTTVNARRASAAKPSARTIHAPTTTLRWMGPTRYCATTPAAPPSCAATTVSHTPYVFVFAHDCISETISLTSALLGGAPNRSVGGKFGMPSEPSASTTTTVVYRQSNALATHSSHTPARSESSDRRPRRNAVLQLHRLPQRLHSDLQRP